MNKIIAALMLTSVFMTASLVKADISSPMTTLAVSNLGISVSGHAEVDAKPDVAYADIGVVVQAANQTDAASQNATKMDAVRASLLKSGVADTDIKTNYYQIEPQYDYRSTPAVLIGYQVSNFLKVTIRNLPKAGLIVDHATQAGANQVNGVTYDLADRNQVEAQALAAAVTNARSKADLMAGVAGVTVGRLLNIEETNQQEPRPMMPMMMSRAMAPGAAPEPTTSLSPQTIVITADVTALYAIGYGK